MQFCERIKSLQQNLYNIHIKVMTLIPLKRKEIILADAKERILKNHTLEQIAKAITFLNAH